jgi:hypothetical protein
MQAAQQKAAVSTNVPTQQQGVRGNARQEGNQMFSEEKHEDNANEASNPG